MDIRPINQSAVWRFAVVGLCLLGVAFSALAQGGSTSGVQISGREIQTFKDGDAPVTVVLGAFELTLTESDPEGGEPLKQTIVGQDAVIWVTPEMRDGVSVNVIHIYAEGGEDGVQVTDVDGNTTGDTTMFVAIETSARVSAEGLQQSGQDVSGMALFRRAKEARREATTADDASAVINEAGDLPELKRIETAPGERESLGPRGDGGVRTSASDSGTSDNTGLPFEVVEAGSGDIIEQDRTTVKPKETPDRLPAAINGDKKEESLTAGPVTFYADTVESTVAVDGVRTTIVRGNVYLAQAGVSSDQYMEMRSQEAVIYSEVLGKDGKAMPVKDTFSPASMPIAGGRENIVGVYLHGDVVMSRGERYMTGPEAYYDFTTDRAIMTDGTFRTVQQDRNIPIVARFKTGRMLSARELQLDDAKLSTSEFYTPTYHFGAKTIYIMDMTPYDAKGEKLSQQHLLAEMEDATIYVHGKPVLPMGDMRTDFRRDHTALRNITGGFSNEYGVTVETEWHFFRLMGLVKPEDVDAILHLDYKRGPTVGLEVEYERENYTGYAKLWGMLDQEDTDVFGKENEQKVSQTFRGRILARHKQFLPRDWQMQFELSVLSDRDYLRKFAPDEYYSGKDQETLVYARKQRDNWAVDVLLKAKVNSFLTQTWQVPELSAYMIGEPILNDMFTFFGESHVGAMKWDPGSLSDREKRDGMTEPDPSSWLGRFDTRAELDMPLHLGPVNVVPYMAGRMTAWTSSPPDGKTNRLYAQTGVRADMTFWTIYKEAKNRLLDINGLRHSISPEGAFFVAGDNDVTPDDQYPLTDIETHMTDLSGVTFGVRQLWETKRGEGAAERNVKWMRLDVTAGFFSNDDSAFQPVSDGRYFQSRPEYSFGDDYVFFDYEWYISDSTTLMADLSYDVDASDIGRASVGLYMERSPRLSYFVGLRSIKELSTAIGTFAIRYKINRKYAIALIEQYDFDYDGGTNLRSEFTITRKFPRWYTSLNFAYDARFDDFTIMLDIWPEGVPEARFSSGAQSMYSSEEN